MVVTMNVGVLCNASAHLVQRLQSCAFSCTAITCHTNIIHTQWVHRQMQANKEKKKQRRQRGANPGPAKASTSGPLTDLADYSYVDGRPAPLAPCQLRRMNQHKEISERIRMLCGELDTIVETDQHKQETQRIEKEQGLNRKFKAKG